MNPDTDKIEGKKSGRWYRFFLNKYLIVTLLFVVWMFFFDQNSYFIHKELDKEIQDLTKAQKTYQQKLEKETIQIHQMKTNAEEIERVAREKHYLKKENEDVFIIEEQKVKKPESHESESK
jgi:cell division protein DivIC